MFRAWREFKKGKLKKQDVASFAVDIEENIFQLRRELANFTYKHEGYAHFVICDPKRRDVHKASSCDRLLHHAVYRVLWPVFDREFIYDSFSSRKNKGMHKAHKRFEQFAWKLSRNKTRLVWVLKCDIRKFFDSVDHSILIGILERKLGKDTMWLMKEIIGSFEKCTGKGIPIGNLTSQLFSNIYLNEFDQFVKRKLRVEHYIRYADDFVILSHDKDYLTKLLPVLMKFLETKLLLSMHSEKIMIRKWNQGIDFLGYVSFPSHQVLRTKTKRRILSKISKLREAVAEEVISEFSFSQSIQSYLGMLKHCRGHVIMKNIKIKHGRR